jgi:uncharacterized protein YoxC
MALVVQKLAKLPLLILLVLISMNLRVMERTLHEKKDTLRSLSQPLGM